MIEENLKKLQENLKELREEAEELINSGNSKEQERGRGILYATTSSYVLFKNYLDSLSPNNKLDIDLIN